MEPLELRSLDWIQVVSLTSNFANVQFANKGSRFANVFGCFANVFGCFANFLKRCFANVLGQFANDLPNII